MKATMSALPGWGPSGPFRRMISAVRTVVVAGGVGVIVFGGTAVSASAGDGETETLVETARMGVFGESVEDTIQVGPGGSLTVVRGAERLEYGPGDVIRTRWSDGAWFIDDRQVRPAPHRDIEEPPKTVEFIKGLYGTVPLVLEYVQKHAGEASDQALWNEAKRAWQGRKKQVSLAAYGYYAELIDGDEAEDRSVADYDEAAERVAETLRQDTVLVAAVKIVEPRYSQYPHRYLRVVWKGLEHESEGMTLGPRLIAGPPPTSPLMSREECDSHVRWLRYLSDPNVSATLEIHGGTFSKISVDRIPETMEER